MRIIRTVDDLQNAILDVLCPVVDRELAMRVARYIIYDDGDPSIVDEVVRRVGNHRFDKLKVEDFSETVFQLRDYKDVLKVYMTILLKCNQYENICAFVNKLIVSHIGNEPYVSKAKQYTIEQRYFDRFIEMINFCGIEPDDCYDFFMAIATAGDNNVLSAWKEPLKEYSNILKNRASDGIIYTSIEDKVVPSQFNETPNVVEEKLEIFESPIRVYSEVKEPVKVKEPKVVPVKKFDSALDFENTVRSTVETMQERMYGIRLKKYYEEEGIPFKSLDGLIMTYVIDQFKTMEEVGFDNVVNSVEFVDESLGHKIARIVYQVATLRNKLLKSKWAMRLISLLGDDETLNKCFDIIAGAYTKNKSACEYFISCLVMSSRREYVRLYRLLNKQKLTNKQRNFIENAMTELSVLLDIDIELLYDEACDDYGLSKDGTIVFDFGRRVLEIRVTPTGEIEYYNTKTGKSARISDKVVFEDLKIKDYLASLKKGISREIKRFVLKQRDFETYSRENFENILLKNNLLHKLAEGILWGRYDGTKLVETFYVKDNLDGVLYSDSYMKGKIGIVHAVELGSRVKEIDKNTLLFDQFSGDVYKSADFGADNDKIEYLFDREVDEKVFVNKLKHREYSVNNLDSKYRYNQLIRVNEKLNLITLVEVKMVSQGEEQYNKTNAQVSFYRLSDLKKDEYGNYDMYAVQPMKLQSVDARVFSDELNLIFDSAK